MSDSVRPHRHRRQPTRLPRPWDSPGKNTGVGCHFLLQCMKVKSESEVAQWFPTLSDPMNCSLPGSSSMGFSRQEYWSFSFSIILSKEHPGLISFSMDWLDLLVVQGTLKSLLQHHSSKASILQCSAFFMGEGNDNPLQYSCLENPRDGEAWWAAIYRVTQSWTRLK